MELQDFSKFIIGFFIWLIAISIAIQVWLQIHSVLAYNRYTIYCQSQLLEHESGQRLFMPVYSFITLRAAKRKAQKAFYPTIIVKGRYPAMQVLY